MTVATIRALLRVLIDEPTTAKWSNANLNALIFSEYRDLVSEITRRNADYYVKSGTVSTIANNKFTALPADLTIVKKLVNSEGDTVRWVHNSQFSHASSIGTPTCFDISGRNIWWDGVPNGVNTYTILYHYMPSDLSAETDVPELPPNFHDILAYGAAVNSRIAKEDQIREYSMQYERKKDTLLHQVSISQTNNAPRVLRTYDASEQ